MLEFKEALEQRIFMSCATSQEYGNWIVEFGNEKNAEAFYEITEKLLHEDEGDIFQILRLAYDRSYEVQQLDGINRWVFIWQWNDAHDAKDLWLRIHWLLYKTSPKQLQD